MKNLFVSLLFLLFVNSVSALEIELPTSVRQGGIFKILIKDKEDSDGKYIITVSNKDFTAFPLGQNTYVAILPVAVAMLPGKQIIDIYVSSKKTLSTSKKILNTNIQIKKFNFPEQKGLVRTKPLSKKELAIREKERAALDKIYNEPNLVRYFNENVLFGAPLSANIPESSPFGIIRWIKYSKTKQVKVHHYGIDYPATIGTSVLAAESGEVRFAGDLLYEGKTVILDHGYGLFSIYAHLSQIVVKEGDVVAGGSKIALSGNTGRVRGAHGGANLHFGVNIGGVWVDPKYFLARPAKPWRSGGGAR